MNIFSRIKSALQVVLAGQRRETPFQKATQAAGLGLTFPWQRQLLGDFLARGLHRASVVFGPPKLTGARLDRVAESCSLAHLTALPKYPNMDPIDREALRVRWMAARGIKTISREAELALRYLETGKAEPVIIPKDWRLEYINSMPPVHQLNGEGTACSVDCPACIAAGVARA